jgi:uncharacterized protein (DUF1800 family)
MTTHGAITSPPLVMATLPSSPIATLRGRFSDADATRLLWRAGFGPRPGDVARLQALGLDGAVASLTRPSGAARLIGRPPHGAGGRPLDPTRVWGDDHCWWLDRMVRSDQPLQERMTLIWHSWFATSVEGATQKLLLGQNAMMRPRWLGSFHDLFAEVTRDPAMLLWLNGAQNNRFSPNENYGREMMELFTLGQGRGYDQRDVKAQARALTGWTDDWTDARGPHNFRFESALHDDGVKTILGHRGRFGWRDACRLCVEHVTHPSFMVAKLWGYFVAEPVPAADARTLERVYVDSGYATRPLVEAILRHPLMYRGARMVLPPVVFCAGMLRALGQTVQSDDWGWIGQLTGQKLFEPPNVAGWDYADWLDTARWAGRLAAVNHALGETVLDPGHDTRYPVGEDAGQALAAALAHWGDPTLDSQTHRHLLGFSARTGASIGAAWEQIPDRVLRQNALRALIPMTPDWQTC